MASATIFLPPSSASGGATAANQTTEIASLASIDAKMSAPSSGVSNNISVDGTGTTLGSTALKVGVTIKADAGNTDTVFVVVSGSSNGILIDAGEKDFFAVNNANLLTIKASSGTQDVSYFAS